MRQKSGSAREPAEQVVKDIRRATRPHFSAKEKIRVVLEGLRGEDSQALSSGRDCPESLLSRVEGVPRSRQETASQRHCAGGDFRTRSKTCGARQTLKNRILLQNYYLPGELEVEIAAFVAGYNHLRYHESLGNLTPADVYFRRGQTILIERERSNDRPSQTDACCIISKPPNITDQMSQSLP